MTNMPIDFFSIPTTHYHIYNRQSKGRSTRSTSFEIKYTFSDLYLFDDNRLDFIDYISNKIECQVNDNESVHVNLCRAIAEINIIANMVGKYKTCHSIDFYGFGNRCRALVFNICKNGEPYRKTTYEFIDTASLDSKCYETTMAIVRHLVKEVVTSFMLINDKAYLKFKIDSAIKYPIMCLS